MFTNWCFSRLPPFVQEMSLKIRSQLFALGVPQMPVSKAGESFTTPFRPKGTIYEFFGARFAAFLLPGSQALLSLQPLTHTVPTVARVVANSRGGNGPGVSRAAGLDNKLGESRPCSDNRENYNACWFGFTPGPRGLCGSIVAIDCTPESGRLAVDGKLGFGSGIVITAPRQTGEYGAGTGAEAASDMAVERCTSPQRLLSASRCSYALWGWSQAGAHADGRPLPERHPLVAAAAQK